MRRARWRPRRACCAWPAPQAPPAARGGPRRAPSTRAAASAVSTGSSANAVATAARTVQCVSGSSPDKVMRKRSGSGADQRAKRLGADGGRPIGHQVQQQVGAVLDPEGANGADHFGTQFVVQPRAPSAGPTGSAARAGRRARPARGWPRRRWSASVACSPPGCGAARRRCRPSPRRARAPQTRGCRCRLPARAPAGPARPWGRPHAGTHRPPATSA